MTETLVAAAASVPASSTSRMALWKLWEGNHSVISEKTQLGAQGRLRGPEVAGDRSCGSPHAKPFAGDVTAGMSMLGGLSS